MLCTLNRYTFIYQLYFNKVEKKQQNIFKENNFWITESFFYNMPHAFQQFGGLND